MTTNPSPCVENWVLYPRLLSRGFYIEWDGLRLPADFELPCSKTYFEANNLTSMDGSRALKWQQLDVFSFGIALWEILTEDEPYADMHCGAMIGGIVSNMLRPPIPESYDRRWKGLMEECWSHDP
ncbi:probable serine/threonine-protein kinase drkD, partial [Tanacetum coccineum]